MNELNLRDLWDETEVFSICVRRISKGKEKVWFGKKEVFGGITDEDFVNMLRDVNRRISEAEGAHTR